MQTFVEYAIASRDPFHWDRAYKEGMASELRKTAQAHKAHDALAVKSDNLKKEVLSRFGVSISKCKTRASAADGIRFARSAGSKDSSSINLKQRQIGHQASLALPAPKRQKTK